MGPKEPHSPVLIISEQEEALVVAFRKHTLLPLDDCLYALQATVPHLTRLFLHRCFRRHGISRLAETHGDKRAAKNKFKSSHRLLPHRHCRGANRGGQALPVRRHRSENPSSPTLSCTRRPIAGWLPDFLKALIKAVPYKIHTVLTDNGIQFTDLPKESSRSYGALACPYVRHAL